MNSLYWPPANGENTSQGCWGHQLRVLWTFQKTHQTNTSLDDDITLKSHVGPLKKSSNNLDEITQLSKLLSPPVLDLLKIFAIPFRAQIPKSQVEPHGHQQGPKVFRATTTHINTWDLHDQTQSLVPYGSWVQMSHVRIYHAQGWNTYPAGELSSKWITAPASCVPSTSLLTPRTTFSSPPSLRTVDLQRLLTWLWGFQSSWLAFLSSSSLPATLTPLHHHGPYPHTSSHTTSTKTIHPSRLD